MGCYVQDFRPGHAGASSSCKFVHNLQRSAIELHNPAPYYGQHGCSLVVSTLRFLLAGWRHERACWKLWVL